MLAQHHLIERVRALAEADARVDALMMYGSFTRGEGDAYSDIEFLLFFEDDAFAQVAPDAWIAQVAPVLLSYVNDFGIVDVIFNNLVRGEFHFHRVSEMAIAESWRGVVSFPSLDATLLVDKSGRMAPLLAPIIGAPPERATPDQLRFLTRHFVNTWLFGFNVLQRGEHARALEMLGGTHRPLLQMARVVEGKTDTWLTPSKALEQELSPEAYARLAACTAPLDRTALFRAYANAWAWGRELLAAIAERHDVALPPALLDAIERALQPAG